MKVLLYQRGEKALSKSGIGRAMKHQVRALTEAGVPFTTDEKDYYDLVHINTVDLGARSMAVKAKKEGKKVVYHAHSTEEDFRNSFIFSNQLSPLFKMHIVSSYELGDYILTPTPYSKKILEGYGIDKPIQDISNGIDLDRFHYDEYKVQKFRKFFNLADDQKVIVSVGLYFERKGLPDFMEVARALPDYTFIWFGHTPLASVTSKVREAIKEKPDNVILPGYIKGDIIEGAYASADVFFFPSYEETEGIVVLEALASKCQTIVRDIGVYDPWLSHGKNCYKGNSIRDFVFLIRTFIKGELPSTVEGGYAVAEERSIEEIGKQLKDVYERVLKGDY
ncbi:glycosyltransferase [Erysipelothrix sp. HDW6C]|uniref:glycosyltransferase family 4 protein n=1 Tax=Erysipelothrix sp. HDW6C TaxID=2714930 RepID=UPI00140969CF|nr:glycosyltransferase [Erysipelothrix sp. HDW6C]QIK68903.1 glycosyltransferase [Erysipelothrix sp. HDW6C]